MNLGFKYNYMYPIIQQETVFTDVQRCKVFESAKKCNKKIDTII